jgi:hypothetical protein
MNCALCKVEIAAESAIDGTMCARCGAGYAGKKPAQDAPKAAAPVVPAVPGTSVEAWRAPPSPSSTGAPLPLTPARETTLGDDVATMLGDDEKHHQQHHSKKNK